MIYMIGPHWQLGPVSKLYILHHQLKNPFYRHSNSIVSSATQRQLQTKFTVDQFTVELWRKYCFIFPCFRSLWSHCSLGRDACYFPDKLSCYEKVCFFVFFSQLVPVLSLPLSSPRTGSKPWNSGVTFWLLLESPLHPASVTVANIVSFTNNFLVYGLDRCINTIPGILLLALSPASEPNFGQHLHAIFKLRSPNTNLNISPHRWAPCWASFIEFQPI